MDSNPSENWPPAELQFRLACEECHQRKIRCDLPPDSSTATCKACRTNKRRCLFSIKSKTGRPRKLATANGGLASVSTPSQRLNGPATEHVISLHEGAGPPRTRRHLTALSPSPPFVDTPENLAGSRNGQPWLLSPSPPVTGVTFGVTALHEFGQQDQKTLFDSILMDSFVFPAPDQSGPPGVPAESETEFLPELETNARLPHAAPSPGPAIPVSNTISDGLCRDATDDFTETLSLCAEIHRACHGRPLHFLNSADQDELASVLRVINDLGSKTHTLTQISPKSPGRQNRYNWAIIHVSVAEAIEMAAGLIKFNLGLLTVQGSGEGAFEQYHSSKDGDEPHRLGDEGPGLVGTRGDAARDMRLESVLALMRLDYSLNKFTLLAINARDATEGASDELHHAVAHLAGCVGEEDREPKAWQIPLVCRCCAGVSAARIQRVRDLGQALVARLRSVW
ncbi:uncharacterized protein B0T15DRAFT_510491 [Chaetomium strumarium]|uniref:Zn(2)-C6 fungal-type domain-containing protein n=1 Tax=Chaetomium strumarium TaxID=1170767 RepID=A0AAJ0M3B4_9PEZI|nr:hypothetical protein B0T15DRAFT_510491 [Chaetomium strumarium]